MTELIELCGGVFGLQSLFSSFFNDLTQAQLASLEYLNSAMSRHCTSLLTLGIFGLMERKKHYRLNKIERVIMESLEVVKLTKCVVK